MYQGQFLIAVPRMLDPNFNRTVVLLVQHDEQGALGLILNRPTGRTVREVWAEAIGSDVACERPIHDGGPVPGPVMAVHCDPLLSEMEVIPGIYFAAGRENLERLVEANEGPFLLFSGYSGWAGGQLEAEMEAGGWITRRATQQDVFASEEDLWRKVGRDITDDVLRDALHIKHAPNDTSMN